MRSFPLHSTLFVVFTATIAHAQLQAPTLWSIEAHADSAVSLEWRNNSSATEYFYILRKASPELLFTALDTVYDSQTSYIDSTVEPSTACRFELPSVARRQVLLFRIRSGGRTETIRAVTPY